MEELDLLEERRLEAELRMVVNKSQTLLQPASPAKIFQIQRPSAKASWDNHSG